MVPWLALLPTSGSPMYFALRNESGDLEFGYDNDWTFPEETSGGSYFTHPTYIFWNGGRVKDISLELELVAGVSPGMEEDIQKVLQRVEEVLSLAMPEKVGENQFPSAVRLIIGRWFVLNCVVKNVTTRLRYPWDDVSGEPYRAMIQLVLTPIFTDQPGATAAPSDLPHAPMTFLNWGANGNGTSPGAGNQGPGVPIPDAVPNSPEASITVTG